MVDVDLLFNLIATLIGGLFAFFSARRREPVEILAGLCLAGLGDLIVAGLTQQGLFHMLRLLAFFTFAHAPALLLVTGWSLRRTHQWGARLSWAGAAVLLLIALDALVVEPQWLQVRHVRLESPKLDRKLRIGVVADLQTDRVGDYERRALTRLMQAQPDLILFPGDYLHLKGPQRLEQVRALNDLFRELGVGAPLGAFAVRGNVEPPGWPAIFAGTEITALEETTTVRTGGIEIAGLDLWDSFATDQVVEPSDRFKIALGHAPDFALGRIGADLLVAGHTHGGQVRLPLIGPLITFSRVPRSWADGTTDLDGGRTLVVSRGVGMERAMAPRLRFLCRPELVLIDVVPAD